MHWVKLNLDDFKLILKKSKSLKSYFENNCVNKKCTGKNQMWQILTQSKSLKPHFLLPPDQTLPQYGFYQLVDFQWKSLWYL